MSTAAPPTSKTTPVEVRDRLADVLELDLIGPSAGSGKPDEVLPYAPSRWYLTGFLIPHEAPDTQKADEEAQDELDLASGDGKGDDEEEPERTSARKAFFPSSLGISVLVPPGVKELQIEARWGDYDPLDVPESEGAGKSRAQHWKRTQRGVSLTIDIGGDGRKSDRKGLPGFEDVKVVWSARRIGKADAFGGLKAGSRAVSVFLVNERVPKPDEQRDQAFIFQAGLVARCPQGFVPRPNLRGLTTTDPDEQVADLQFRDVYEFAVGHGVSTRAGPEGEACHRVETAWIPRADVEKVVASSVGSDVELGMDALARCTSAAEVKGKLGGLAKAFGEWIDQQRKVELSEKGRRDVAQDLLKRASVAQKRIADGLECLVQPEALEAFRVANRTMAAAARQRASQQKPPEKVEPAWRPFQIAFLLMNLRGVCEPEHADREVVDLLFFPTGGGKTEAYLGLAAFTLVLRRLRNPGVLSAGMSVLMRYTLRLLTLDQLGRAATLICALELERQKNVARLGPWPFEIGLWVGKAATPNKMGRKGDNDKESARARTIAYKNDDKKPLPIPIENCPWCGTKFAPSSFNLVPNPDQPTDLRIVCVGRSCDFHSKSLPILAVDEPIYRRLPCFLIATLDKFAALPWVGEVGALFGNVERHDAAGFYGPCDPREGAKLERPLLPPDLIIQDELHLISGPLGTMAGLYEAGIDALCTRKAGDKGIRPKIVASTATVRRAEAQIRALFARSAVDVFPPPGPDRRDSFFARTVPTTQKAGRRYVGIAAPGRSLKVVLLRTYLALLAGAQKLYLGAGGDKASKNPADPYMTLLGYFNSLRELGGARRIVEDEVLARLESYGGRLRVGETGGQGLFAGRRIAFDVVELTSREPNSAVARAKRRLELPVLEKEHVDVAIATNMISVGLDITRLGLMVVFGQPKMTAEYIQATSRVGRDEERPGLVVTLLNVHRPRDRSHYERFEAYHLSFYRAVEATSVTPFSPRAVDRGLAGVAVGLARHGLAAMTPPLAAALIEQLRGQLGFVADTLGRRAEAHARGDSAQLKELRERVRARTNALLDDWASIAAQNAKVQAGLQYQHEAGGAPPLLFAPLDPDLATKPAKERQFRANRSLRDVEPTVNVWVKRLSGEDVEAEEQGDY